MVPPVKIAVLDDYQHAAAAHFARLPAATCDLTIFTDTLPAYTHPETTEQEREQLVARLRPFAIIVTTRERTPFSDDLIAQLPRLRVLLTTGPYNNAIDVGSCKEHGVIVAGTRWPRVMDGVDMAMRDPTLQHTVALILSIAGNLAAHDATVKAGGWQSHLNTGLPGKTCAILGLGRLGGLVARIMHQAFGMKIIAWSPHLTQDSADARAEKLGLPARDGRGAPTFRAVSKETLMTDADVLTVHLVLSSRSRGILQADDLAKMKRTAFLVNTSRGPLIDESALLDVLQRGAIKGAALDVFDVEPLPLNSVWRTTQWGTEGRGDVLLSPHMGYVEESLISFWHEEAVENIEKWLRGEKLHQLFY